MRSLAVDTATNICGIAVADENGLLAEYMINDRKTHSQKLVPMLDELLDSLGLKPADIDVFALLLLVEASACPG
jgi:tRNA threonylcarbamoyladenosine biosynthesis protein TsaB